MSKIISIFGGSGSGKSSLARVLENYDPDSFSRVPADRLIESKASEDSRYFANPIRYDWEYLQKLLRNKQKGEYVHLPLFDYDSFTRTADTSDKRFVIADYLIIDAIQPYAKADWLFYIDLSEEVRKKRIIDRDMSQKTNMFRNWDWSVIADNYYRNKHMADSVVLDGNKSTDALMNEVLKALNI